MLLADNPQPRRGLCLSNAEPTLTNAPSTCRPLPAAPCVQHLPPARLPTHRVSREQRLLVDHLCKDAANAPEVYWRGVVLDAQQDFGGAVPQCDDLAGWLAKGGAGRRKGGWVCAKRSLQEAEHKLMSDKGIPN